MKHLTLVLALVAIHCSPEPPPLEIGRIDRVVDGDTAHVEGFGSVRFIGIDCPETVHPREPIGCYGPEADRQTRELLPEGELVRLYPGYEDEDRYGRKLRYLQRVEDGLDVNLALAEEGYCEMTTFPHPRQDEFLQAEITARYEYRGLWGVGVCEEEKAEPQVGEKGHPLYLLSQAADELFGEEAQAKEEIEALREELAELREEMAELKASRETAPLPEAGLEPAREFPRDYDEGLQPDEFESFRDRRARRKREDALEELKEQVEELERAERKLAEAADDLERVERRRTYWRAPAPTPTPSYSRPVPIPTDSRQ